MTDIRLRPRFTDYLIVPDLSTLLNSYYYRWLWLKFHCNVINEQILAQMHTSLSYIYLLSFGHFLFSLAFKKQPNGNKYNSGLCVFVPKFAYIYHNNTMKPQS